MTTILNILKNIPFFQFLNQETDLEIIKKIHLHYFPPNHVIFQKGDFGDKMYVIRSGKVKIYTWHENHEKSMDILEKNHFFGEMALISEEGKRAYSVKTLEECEVFTISKKDLYTVLEKNPKIARNLKEQFLEKIKKYHAHANL